MIRRILFSVSLICVLIALPSIVTAEVLEQPSLNQNVNFVQIDEGVFEATTPEGAIYRRYVGVIGLEKRLAALRRGRAALEAQTPYDEDLITKIRAIGYEIRMLEKALDQSAADQAQPEHPAKILETDCEASYANPDVDTQPYGMAGVDVHSTAEFTAYGECRAYAGVYAYYWDAVVGANSDSDNSGGYTDSIDLEVSAAGPRNQPYCWYGSAIIYFNAGRGPAAAYGEYPEDCYCPECSSPEP